MFRRQTTGSVVCASCGYLVGVNDDKCYNCGRRNPGLWGFAPVIRRLGYDFGFVPFVIGTCGILFVLTWAISGGNVGGGGLLDLLPVGQNTLIFFGASGYLPIFALGRWWTVLSAGWLHAGLLHIAFNMMWIRQLAPPVGEFYGPGRMVIIYTVAGATGFALTSIVGPVLGFLPFLHGAPITVGASAPIFGLLGALVYYGRRTGSHAVRSQAVYYAVTLFVFGLIMSGVDNYAHAGGFLGGYVMSRILDPLKPERVTHLAIGFGCLVLSILSIIVSVLHAFTLR
jgi:rhomboid protease GluP